MSSSLDEISGKSPVIKGGKKPKNCTQHITFSKKYQQKHGRIFDRATCNEIAHNLKVDYKVTESNDFFIKHKIPEHQIDYDAEDMITLQQMIRGKSFDDQSRGEVSPKLQSIRISPPPALIQRSTSTLQPLHEQISKTKLTRLKPLFHKKIKLMNVYIKKNRIEEFNTSMDVDIKRDKNEFHQIKLGIKDQDHLHSRFQYLLNPSIEQRADWAIEEKTLRN